MRKLKNGANLTRKGYGEGEDDLSEFRKDEEQVTKKLDSTAITWMKGDSGIGNSPRVYIWFIGLAT